jgi:hypothetical protein
MDGFRRLDQLTRAVEEDRDPFADFDAALGRERMISVRLGEELCSTTAHRRRRRSIRFNWIFSEDLLNVISEALLNLFCEALLNVISEDLLNQPIAALFC